MVSSSKTRPFPPSCGRWGWPGCTCAGLCSVRVVRRRARASAVHGRRPGAAPGYAPRGPIFAKSKCDFSSFALSGDRARLGVLDSGGGVAGPHCGRCTRPLRRSVPLQRGSQLQEWGLLRPCGASPSCAQPSPRHSPTPAASFAAAAAAGAGDSAMVFYKLTVDGEEVDSNIGRQVMEVKLGSGGVIPGFEAALMGMVRAASFSRRLCLLLVADALMS